MFWTDGHGKHVVNITEAEGHADSQLDLVVGGLNPCGMSYPMKHADTIILLGGNTAKFYIYHPPGTRLYCAQGNRMVLLMYGQSL